jgi:hypothetical protein
MQEAIQQTGSHGITGEDSRPVLESLKAMLMLMVIEPRSQRLVMT